MRANFPPRKRAASGLFPPQLSKHGCFVEGCAMSCDNESTTETNHWPRLLTLQQVCAALNISVSTGRKLVRNGRLFPVRLSRRLTFDMRDVEQLINSTK